jgi:HSP20 family protein
MTMGGVGKDFWPVHWLNEGWSKLRDQAHSALTHFSHEDGEEEDAAGSQQPQRWGVVATDVVDNGQQIEVRMEVPGLTKDDLSIELGHGRLTVSGEKHMTSSRRDGNVLINERAFGSFHRVIPLPYEVDPSSATAEYVDGTLVIDIDKIEGAERKTIKVT